MRNNFNLIKYSMTAFRVRKVHTEHKASKGEARETENYQFFFAFKMD